MDKKEMNIIFLDIDGVLNTDKTCVYYDNETIVEDDKLILLKSLIEETQSKIVLISTKKVYWEKNNKNKQSYYGNYLDKTFAKYGLSIYDKTIDDGIHRGLGVLAWKSKNNAKNIVILDDDEEGYDAITKAFYLVNISNKDGLSEQNLEKAKALLSRSK